MKPPHFDCCDCCAYICMEVPHRKPCEKCRIPIYDLDEIHPWEIDMMRW